MQLPDEIDPGLAKYGINVIAHRSLSAPVEFDPIAMIVLGPAFCDI
jgi:hypothetical protein